MMTPHLQAVTDDTSVMDPETDETEAGTEGELEEVDQSAEVEAYQHRAPETVGSHPLLDRATETGITFTAKTGKQEWADLIPVIIKTENAGPWVLGDALNYGEDKWGEAASVALDIDSIHPQTAANAQSLCRSYPPDDRFPELRTTHHRDALKLTEPHRTRALKFAAYHGLSVTEFRDFVEQIVDDIPEAQSERSKQNTKPATHVTFTLSFTLLIDDEEGGQAIQDALVKALENRMRKDDIQATKVTPSRSYPKNIQA